MLWNSSIRVGGHKTQLLGVGKGGVEFLVDGRGIMVQADNNYI